MSQVCDMIIQGFGAYFSLEFRLLRSTVASDSGLITWPSCYEPFGQFPGSEAS